MLPLVKNPGWGSGHGHGHITKNGKISIFLPISVQGIY